MSSPIPRTANGFEPDHPGPEPPTYMPGEGKPTVMVIDDSIIIRTVLEASFNRVGVPVNSFPDGLAAIQALSKGAAPVPAVVLLDINLPRMDGYEVARILRGHKQFKDTTILMLTGRDGIVDRMKSHWVGAHEYIKKPFRISDLVQTSLKYLHINLPESGEPPISPPDAPRG